jgi:16S rRNA processing protein RimM
LSEKICIAKILTAHGVRGLVRLDCFLDAPESLETYNPLETASGQPVTLHLKNPIKGRWLAEIDGVTDRTAAEKWRNTELFVDREALPELEEGHYIADLVGREIRLNGAILGHVAGVENFGAGDLLEIRPLSGKNFYLPLTDAHVPEIAEDHVVVADIEEFRA